ncbi:hypothetical protein BDR06DRAFT_971902 [Suillus hirtellus]|nr:hypothetical protein BDR06DRAFT_971902 [Suillus hirtellus]
MSDKINNLDILDLLPLLLAESEETIALRAQSAALSQDDKEHMLEKEEWLKNFSDVKVAKHLMLTHDNKVVIDLPVLPCRDWQKGDLLHAAFQSQVTTFKNVMVREKKTPIRSRRFGRRQRRRLRRLMNGWILKKVRFSGMQELDKGKKKAVVPPHPPLPPPAPAPKPKPRLKLVASSYHTHPKNHGDDDGQHYAHRNKDDVETPAVPHHPNMHEGKVMVEVKVKDEQGQSAEPQIQVVDLLDTQLEENLQLKCQWVAFWVEQTIISVVVLTSNRIFMGSRGSAGD